MLHDLFDFVQSDLDNHTAKRQQDTTKCSGGFRGGSGGSLEPPSGTKLFQFHGEIYKKLSKMLKTNPLLINLNPPSRNPGSAPEMIKEQTDLGF